MVAKFVLVRTSPESPNWRISSPTSRWRQPVTPTRLTSLTAV